MTMIIPKCAKARTGIISAEAAIRLRWRNEPRTQRGHQGARRASGETGNRKFSGPVFFWRTMKGQHEPIKETLSRGKWSRLDGVHVGDPSGSATVLDRRSGHTSRPEFSSSLGEGSRLRYLTFFLHGL